MQSQSGRLQIPIRTTIAPNCADGWPVITILPAEQVLVTVGSTAMLSLLCQTMLGPGLNAVTSERSFIVYSMAVHATGAQLIETPLRDDGFDLSAILSAINEHTRLVFLANPNNPTGTLLDPASVDEFMARVPTHVVVVLDEAYYDFAAHFAVAAQGRVFAFAELCQAGSKCGCAENFFQGAWARRTSRGIWLGTGRVAGLLRADARHIFRVVRRAGSGAWPRSTIRITSHEWLPAMQSRLVVLTEGLSRLGYESFRLGRTLFIAMWAKMRPH